MKLKFEIKSSALAELVKILDHLVKNYWQDKGYNLIVYFYIDEDSMIIYPPQCAGFDRIFARLLITDLSDTLDDFKIESQQPKNAVVFTPEKFQDFIDFMKICGNNDFKAKFHLKQTA